MTDTRYGSGVLAGLFAGALLGTAAGVLFAPQIQAALRNLRRELTDAAADARDTVDDLQEKGRGAYGKALSVVARGAEEVKERVAEAAHRSS